jgi:hypothetical protein
MIKDIESHLVVLHRSSKKKIAEIIVEVPDRFIQIT